MAERARALVLDLCHEVANLLAAARLEGWTSSSTPSPSLERLLSRAGALIGLVRAILDSEVPGDAAEATDVVRAGAEPLEVLSALRSAFESVDAERVRVDLAGAVDLPGVAADACALADLMAAEIHAALGSESPPERIRAVARRDGDVVTFAVEEEGARSDRAVGPRARGRELTQAVAALVVGAWGGAIRRGHARLELELPVVPTR